MTRFLPVFKGYTVDARLKEFRKADLNQPLEFISFDSPKGERLLVQYVKSLNLNDKRDYQIASEIFG